jgi:hypothetical protein
VSFRALLTLTVAAGAGYVAARELMSDGAAARIERLPDGAQGPALAARARLLRGRERAGEELLAEYHRKVGRT